MASREEAHRKLQAELDKAKKLRDDEKAWKKQAEQVSKANKEYRKTFEKH